MRALVILLLTVTLAACGFQLRGSYTLPWDTLYIGFPENTPIYADIKRGIEASTQTRIVTDPKKAQASFIVLADLPTRTILSLNAAGQVREFQLTRSFVYKIQDTSGKELVPSNQIILQREMTFDDAHLLPKEAEEVMIQREMQQDLVQQLLRRLSSLKLKPGN
jgi:LPS-assembly lipoprotein